MDIQQIKKEYFGQIDSLDLDLIISHVIKKPREFVLAHPEKTLSKNQETKIKRFIKRRIKNEPLAYILGHKEFYGLDFLVDKSTLIPRPETELLVGLVLSSVSSQQSTEKNNFSVIDVGTGSGNIIVSIAKKITDDQLSMTDLNYFAVDISKEALRVARKNISKHELKNKIKVIHSSLLDFIFKNKNYRLKTKNLIIIANLPYLSEKIYSVTAPNVKNFEPKSALLSSNHGLAHYENLLKQIKKLASVISHQSSVISYMEISPEQKSLLSKLIKEILPQAKIKFYRDLSKKWRACQVKI